MTLEPRVRLAASLAGLVEEPAECLRRLSRMGFPAVQISITTPGLRPRDLDGASRRALRGLLRRLELGLSGLDLWIPVGDFLDPARCDRAAGAVVAAIELAADLASHAAADSAPNAAAGSHARRPGISLVLPAASEEGGVREIVEGLLAEADRQGIDLVDCGVPVQAPSVGHGHRWLFGLDLPAWQAAGGIDPGALILAQAERLASVRLADLSRSGMRVPIADDACGAAAFDARLEPAMLAASLSLLPRPPMPVADPRQWSDPWRGLEQTLEVWQRAVSAGAA